MHQLLCCGTNLKLFSLLVSFEYDPEQFADQELPILIVGTKEVRSLWFYMCERCIVSSNRTRLVVADWPSLPVEAATWWGPFP